MKKSILEPNDMLHAFVMVNAKDCYTFLHVTDTEENAQNIIKNGFRYVDNFHKTTDQFTDYSMVSLNWIRVIRKDYGKYVVVIQIDRTVMKKYGSDIDELSGGPISKNSEFTYILPKQYVLGYFDEKNLKVVSNDNFRSSFEMINKTKHES